ncbi:MAG: septum formation initiator family protein [Nitrospirota bacterium]
MYNERTSVAAARRKQKRLVFITVVISLTIYLSFMLVLGENGLITYLDRRSSIQKIQHEIKTISSQNELTKDEIDSFYSDNTFLIERLAREYGYARPNELIYKFKDDKPEIYDKSGPLK